MVLICLLRPQFTVDIMHLNEQLSLLGGTTVEEEDARKEDDFVLWLYPFMS